MYREHLAKLEAIENPTRSQQINIKVAREWIAEMSKFA